MQFMENAATLATWLVSLLPVNAGVSIWSTVFSEDEGMTLKSEEERADEE